MSNELLSSLEKAHDTPPGLLEFLSGDCINLENVRNGVALALKQLAIKDNEQ